MLIHVGPLPRVSSDQARAPRSLAYAAPTEKASADRLSTLRVVYLTPAPPKLKRVASS